MKKLLLGLVLLTSPALADGVGPGKPFHQITEEPKIPDMVQEPTQVIARLIQFFNDPKIAKEVPLYNSDVLPLLQTLQGCAGMQIPDGKGECPGHQVK
jgi:hypothetical protein